MSSYIKLHIGIAYCPFFTSARYAHCANKLADLTMHDIRTALARADPSTDASTYTLQWRDRDGTFFPLDSTDDLIKAKLINNPNDALSIVAWRPLQRPSYMARVAMMCGAGALLVVASAVLNSKGHISDAGEAVGVSMGAWIMGVCAGIAYEQQPKK